MSKHLDEAWILVAGGIGLLFLLGLFIAFCVLRFYFCCCDCEMNIDDEVLVQPRENSLRNQRRQDFNCFVSNNNRSFTLNNQRQQESDHFVAVQIESFNHQLQNDFPTTYEDALRQDQKIQEKPPEYLELYI